MKAIIDPEKEELRERIRQLEQQLAYEGQTEYRGLSLTRLDRALLAALRKSAPNIISTDHLADILSVSGPTIKVAVCRLRKRLRPAGREVRIVTAHGEGYSMPEATERHLAALAMTAKEKK